MAAYITSRHGLFWREKSCEKKKKENDVKRQAKIWKGGNEVKRKSDIWRD